MAIAAFQAGHEQQGRPRALQKWRASPLLAQQAAQGRPAPPHGRASSSASRRLWRRRAATGTGCACPRPPFSSTEGPFLSDPPPRCRLATRLVCGTAPLSSSVGSVLRLQDRACFSTVRGVKLMCSGVLVARRAWQAASGDRRPPSPRADGGLSRRVLRRSMACRRTQLLPPSTVRRPERRLCAPLAHDDRTGRGPDRWGFTFMLLPKAVGSRRASAFPVLRVARKRAGLPALRPDYTAGGPEGGRRPICLRAAGVSEHHERQGNAAVNGPLRPQFSIIFDRAWSG